MLTEQEKKELKLQMENNKHEIFVISIEEMDAIIRSSPRGDNPDVRNRWEKVKDKLNKGANYYASADDAIKMTKLVSDLGSFGAKAYIKNYRGKPHIVLKGNPGLRKILTGTKYGMKNPKVISMGLGRAGAIGAAKQGGILTVILLTTFRVIDFFLTDEMTLTHLIGTLATDVVKVGIATGTSIAMAAAVGGVTLAIGPILAVVFVGVGMSIILDEIDTHFKITERVIAGLDELGKDAKYYLEQKNKQAKKAANHTVDSVIDYAVESAKIIAVRWINSQLKQYMSPVPRIR